MDEKLNAVSVLMYPARILQLKLDVAQKCFSNDAQNTKLYIFKEKPVKETKGQNASQQDYCTIV